MATKVAGVHGAKAPHLSRVKALVSALSGDLTLHMQKEERMLFPAIRAIEDDPQLVIPINAPINVMEQEHDGAGALLSELRAITGGYVAPPWACGTFRALYQGLAELDSDMHVHVHLENNVLFRRAMDLSRLYGSPELCQTLPLHMPESRMSIGRRSVRPVSRRRS